MPKLIALCGAPESGKSAVQDILTNVYDVQAIDDGWPMRDFAIRHCGARVLDVVTQAGKAQVFEFPGGKRMTMREFLGEFGNAIETILGADAIPAMALRAAAREKLHCSFGSVRRKQGHLYKKHGGVVVEVVRPGVKSVNEFDQYDRSCVDIVISNNSDLGALEAKVKAAIGPLFA